jgi:hypothetical protein
MFEKICGKIRYRSPNSVYVWRCGNCANCVRELNIEELLREPIYIVKYGVKMKRW